MLFHALIACSPGQVSPLSGEDCPSAADLAATCTAQDEWLVGDLAPFWAGLEGYGWASSAAWFSAGGTALYVLPAGEFVPGFVFERVGPDQVEVAVTDGAPWCAYITCSHPSVSGNVTVFGELADCADTGGEGCLAGTLDFRFDGITLASGGTIDGLTLSAGFGPDRPTPP